MKSIKGSAKREQSGNQTENQGNQSVLQDEEPSSNIEPVVEISWIFFLLFYIFYIWRQLLFVNTLIMYEKPYKVPLA